MVAGPEELQATSMISSVLILIMAQVSARTVCVARLTVVQMELEKSLWVLKVIQIVPTQFTT